MTFLSFGKDCFTLLLKAVKGHMADIGRGGSLRVSHLQYSQMFSESLSQHNCETMKVGPV